jgi:hypothetical protein
VTNPLINVGEKLTHEHKVVYHLVVLSHLKRRWSLRGRRGIGFSLPPIELVRQDSAISW